MIVQEAKEREERKHSNMIFWGITIIGSIIYWVFMLLRVIEPKEGGDIISAVGAWFEGLAFVGVIWAITLQSRELGLQRKQLRLQHDELGLQREAQQESAEALKLQVKLMRQAAQLNAMATVSSADSTDIRMLNQHIKGTHDVYELGKGNDPSPSYLRVQMMVESLDLLKQIREEESNVV